MIKTKNANIALNKFSPINNFDNLVFFIATLIFL